MPFLLFKAIYVLIVCGTAVWLWQVLARAAWVKAMVERIRAARARAADNRRKAILRQNASATSGEGRREASRSDRANAGEAGSNGAFGKRTAATALPDDEVLGKLALRAKAERMAQIDPEALSGCIAAIDGFLESKIALAELTARLTKGRDELDKSWDKALTLEFDMPFEQANAYRHKVRDSRQILNDCIAWCVAQRNITIEKSVDWDNEYPTSFSWI